jgi:NTE family protein
MNKTALAISGGGSKGAFAVGVIKYLIKNYPKLTFDMVVGTSTGSLIAPLAALGKIDVLENLYTTMTTNQIITDDNLLLRVTENSIYGVMPLWQIINNTYTDQFYTDLLNSGKEVYINTTCLQSEDLVVFTTAANPFAKSFYKVQKFVNADQFRRAILASACQPVFMTPIQVNQFIAGDPNATYQFVDGGVREYIGIEIAVDNGAEEIIAIILSPENQVPSPNQFTSLVPLLGQTIDIFTTDVGKNDVIIPLLYNEALAYINAVKNKMKQAGIADADIANYFTIDTVPDPFQNKIPLQIRIIRPQAALGGGPGGLTFNPAEMKGMLATGEIAIQNYIAGIPPGNISWA